MTHRIALYIAVIVTAICSVTIFLAISVPQQRVDDACIFHNPPVIISGFMRSINKTFTDTQYEYYLKYQGNRKTTGDECQESQMVTKDEYERRMYMWSKSMIMKQCDEFIDGADGGDD